MPRKWAKPIEGFLKINWDGAVDTETSTRSVRWGFVIRDSEGDVVCAGAGKVNHAEDALQVEAFEYCCWCRNCDG